MFARYMGWRRFQLKLDYTERFGDTVSAGPFKGVRLIAEFSELPKFLGLYESALHAVIEELLRRPYDVMLNIGCAEGYYAVGFAHAMPQLRLHAFDIDPVQRNRCEQTARLNGLEGRISVSGLFEGRMFDTFADQRTLVICDIEGAEVGLLQPDKWPSLTKMDFLVELHEGVHPDIRAVFDDRFRHTHDVRYIERQLIVPDLARLEQLYENEMDQLVAVYENRYGKTSWVILMAKRRGE
jgi:hypothetical protein